ncbi:hypothetical protein L1887_36259 [Cichorium endivia]|nr:hypothetical protein L1887_36259 [Cichorium endivia]
MENEWSEVRRRQKRSRAVGGVNVTTFFVSNFTDGTKKEELWKSFDKFGKVIDVYMALKKTRNGFNYAFVGFKDVFDEEDMERKIAGVKINGRTLTVNLAKYDRKGELVSNRTRSRSAVPPLTRSTNGYRDSRSFAEVLRPTTRTTRMTEDSGNQAPPIQFVCSMIKLLYDKGEVNIELKYIGGLRTLLVFNNSLDAKRFKDDESRWKEMLKWVCWGEQANPRFDRVTWIRIIGLPLQLWSEKNFAAITDNFGTTIAPFDEIYNRVDLSHAKIGILTARRSRINEEVMCSIDGKTFKIGVIEFDDSYWFPFKFDPPPEVNTNESSDDDDIDDEDDEHGEPVIGDVGDSGVPRNYHNIPIRSEEQKSEDKVFSVSKTADMGDPHNSEVEESSFNGKVGESIPTQIVQPNGSNFLDVGPFNELIKDRCFGPFPSPTIATMGNPIDPDVQRFEVDGSGSKRRRLSKATSRISSLPIENSHLVTNLENFLFPPPVVNLNVEHGTHPPTPFDLNKRCNSSSSESTTSNRNTMSYEIRKTVEIGKKIGLGISTEDPILQEILRGDGGKEVNQ